MESFLSEHDIILTEAAVVEQLRHSPDLALHPSLVHALLIYEEQGRKALDNIFHAYLDIAQAAGLPMLLSTPTWRANRQRLADAGVERDVNGDAVRYLQQVREQRGIFGSQIKIGGMISCCNDCYRPQESLSADEAEKFHSWQIERLAAAGVDYLTAVTLPAIEEVRGIVRAIEKPGLPYIISFVINRHGCVLDGTPLPEAIATLDAEAQHKPIGYMVNCVYPTFICADQQPPALFKRLLGIQGNASSLDCTELDESDEIKSESVEHWGEAMLHLHKAHGIKILGGCCGTGTKHLEYLTANRKS